MQILFKEASENTSFGIEIFLTKGEADQLKKINPYFFTLHNFAAWILNSHKRCKFFLQCDSETYVFLESWQDDESIVRNVIEELKQVAPDPTA